jgi:hypothetical protein
VTAAAPAATAPQRRPAWPVGVLVGVLLLPPLVLAARQLVAGLPEVAAGSDPALVELATIDAARGRQLLGPYSRFGFHHPGPAMFYALLPGYLFGGRSHGGLLFGALLVNLLALAATAVAATRLGERRLALAVLALLPLLVLRVGPAGLSSAWNPNLVVLAFVATVVAGTAVAAGATGLLLVLVAAGSLAAQSHLGLMAPVATVLAAVAAARLLRRSRPALADAAHRPRSRWPVATALAVAVVMWTPVALEQVSTRPGNLTRIAAYLAGSRPPQPAGEVVSAYGRAAGSWLTAPFSGAVGGRMTVALSLALVVAQPLVLAVAVRRRRGPLVVLAALGLALVPVALVTLHGVAGELHEYLTRWIGGLGLTHAAVLAAALLPRWMDEGGRATWSRTAALAAVAGIGVLAAGLNLARIVAYPSWREQAAASVFARIGRAGAAASACAGPGDRVHVSIGEGTSWELAAGVVLRLTKEGRAVSVDPQRAFMFGPGRAGPADGVRLLVCEAGPACVAGETVWQEEGIRLAVLRPPG